MFALYGQTQMRRMRREGVIFTEDKKIFAFFAPWREIGPHLAASDLELEARNPQPETWVFQSQPPLEIFYNLDRHFVKDKDLTP